MVPSKIKIESFATRYHMGTLGGKGLTACFFLLPLIFKMLPKMGSHRLPLNSSARRSYESFSIIHSYFKIQILAIRN